MEPLSPANLTVLAVTAIILASAAFVAVSMVVICLIYSGKNKKKINAHERDKFPEPLLKHTPRQSSFRSPIPSPEPSILSTSSSMNSKTSRTPSNSTHSSKLPRHPKPSQSPSPIPQTPSRSPSLSSPSPRPIIRSPSATSLLTKSPTPSESRSAFIPVRHSLSKTETSETLSDNQENDEFARIHETPQYKPMRRGTESNTKCDPPAESCNRVYRVITNGQFISRHTPYSSLDSAST